MVTAKRLLQMARKWHRMAVAGRRRIASPKSDDRAPAEPSSSQSAAAVPSKGTFVVYSRDGGRFVVPLAYLNTPVFRELLKISEEEFGLPNDGPIVMPCEAALMEQVVSTLRRRAPREAEKEIISAIASARCCSSAAPPLGIDHQPLPVRAF
ncbi:unnamed protein product [Spirodela intermedia]|uniref:Uncharacterized protein n=1 Tax=Spirodela intermedia TaxID=51605 RepID=A0A7I8J1R6_SPIIN|nr:unnamed protein product [Spirodela intermedia]CAA6663260.1 unnamed protein product [Spirodela intermedia]